MLDFFINLSEKLPSLAKDIIISIFLLVLGYGFLKVAKNIVVRQLKRISKDNQNLLTYKITNILAKHFLPITYFGLFYLTIKEIQLHKSILGAVKTFSIIATTFCVGKLLVDIARILIEYYSQKYHNSNKEIERKINALFPALRVVIWTLATIFILSNLGFDIGAIVAGLGIGGVALALASQGILQDLFSYFAILFDRPFEISDLVAVDDYIGFVEHIGIKTTRIKALTGEQLILANTDLTNSRLRNFKRMQRRQVILKIGVVYETENEILETIPDIIKEALIGIKNITFDVAFFSGFGNFSLNFDIIYYVHSNELYISRMAQNEVNFAIKKAFSHHKIIFAYPTQTLYVNNN